MLFSDCESQLCINQQHRYKSFTHHGSITLWVQVQRYLVNSIKSTVSTTPSSSGEHIWILALEDMPCMWLSFHIFLLLSLGLVRPARTARSFWSAPAGHRSLMHSSSQFLTVCWVCICGGLGNWSKRNFNIYYCGKAPDLALFVDIAVINQQPALMDAKEPGASCTMVFSRVCKPIEMMKVWRYCLFSFQELIGWQTLTRK